MPQFNLGLDMRAPEFGTPAPTLYAAALEMAEFVDAKGIDYVSLQEHHGSADGYLPAPFVMGAAVAARTKRVRIQLAAVLLPLHDPIKIAEQMAVLDLVSGGRLEVVFGAGYVKSEFARFGVSVQDRGRLLDEGIPIIQRALQGERFTVGGRDVFVRPLPARKPYPLMVVGGGVEATAKRAARLGIGLYPMNPAIIPVYEQECKKLGHTPRLTFNMATIHVSEDPDATWKQIAPHVLHHMKSYAEMSEAGGASSSPFAGVTTMEAAKKSGLYQVVTPDQALGVIGKVWEMRGDVALTPLIGGLDPKIGWKSLELFVDKVLPRAPKAA